MTLDPELLAILVCPVCRTSLRYEAEPERLICERCGHAFPVREGIPILLLEEAQPVSKFDTPSSGP
jgi:uncharacterized protein YbaR (Trm112 family)